MRSDTFDVGRTGYARFTVSVQEPLVDPAMGQASDTESVAGLLHHTPAYAFALVFAPPLVDGFALLLGVVVVGQDTTLGWAYAVVALALLVCGIGWRGRIKPRLSDDLPRLLGLLALPVLILAPLFPPSELGEFVGALPRIVAFVLIARGALYWLMHVARSRGLIVEPTLVVGTGRLGLKIANTLGEHREYGLKPVGFIGSFDGNRGGEQESREHWTTGRLPLPLMGPVDRLARIVRERRIRRVIVAFDCTSTDEMIPVLRECDRLPVEIHVIPRFFELGIEAARSTMDDVWGISLMRLRRSALRSFWWHTKRVVDVALATVLLILTSPVLIVAIVAVRATSHGPIFFRQVRVGQRGQRFRLIKLRTLYVNDDGDVTWTTDGDHRVTPVGRFLRRTCIDELPQLINVLLGQMSFVGPRPERPYFFEQFRKAIPGYGDRLRVPAGITGWAQVHGLRGDTSIAERARFDNQYVEHWSPWRDAVILARTIGTVLRGKGY
jgi:exopolysaccharide biosynthesis polyprenyl glycosylphosphotransferase